MESEQPYILPVSQISSGNLLPVTWLTSTITLHTASTKTYPKPCRQSNCPRSAHSSRLEPMAMYTYPQKKPNYNLALTSPDFSTVMAQHTMQFSTHAHNMLRAAEYRTSDHILLTKTQSTPMLQKNRWSPSQPTLDLQLPTLYNPCHLPKPSSASHFIQTRRHFSNIPVSTPFRSTTKKPLLPEHSERPKRHQMHTYGRPLGTKNWTPLNPKAPSNTFRSIQSPAAHPYCH